MTHPATSQGGEPAVGTTAPAATTQNPAAPQQVTVSRSETNAFVMRLIGEHGTAERALMKLGGEQLKYRKRAQEAERQAAELRKQVPADGAVVLVGDQAKAYQELKTQNIDLTKVPAMIKEGSELRSKVAKEERAAAVKQAAGTKYKEKVLGQLLGDKNVLEFKDVLVKKDDGSGTETVKQAYVKNGDTLEALDTYLDREHKDWMDVLKAEEGEGGGSSGGASSSSSTSSSSTATMPRQSSTTSTSQTQGKPKPAETVDRMMSAKYMTPSQRREQSKGS